jgi:hypothetical protein
MAALADEAVSRRSNQGPRRNPMPCCAKYPGLTDRSRARGSSRESEKVLALDGKRDSLPFEIEGQVDSRHCRDTGVCIYSFDNAVVESTFAGVVGISGGIQVDALGSGGVFACLERPANVHARAEQFQVACGDRRGADRDRPVTAKIEVEPGTTGDGQKMTDSAAAIPPAPAAPG